MRINTNVSSLVAQESATNTGKVISSSLEKLSSGLRINKASDDSSGLAIADKLRTQATSIGQGISNGNSAVALLQIADKSMGEQSNILDTIKSKLVQANTDTTSDAGRESIRKDIAKLLTQLDNIATQTNYNGKSLLADVKDGKLTGKDAVALNFQIGASNSDIISTANINATSTSLGGGDKDISKVGAGKTENVKNYEGGTLTVEGKTAADANAALDINVSGNMGTVSGVGGTITIKVTDSASIAALNKLSASTDLTKVSDGEYTIADTKSVDLSSINLTNARITAASGDSFTTTGSTLKIENNDQVNNVSLTAKQEIGQEEVTINASSKDNLTLSVTGNATGGLNINVTGNLATLTTSGNGDLTVTVTSQANIDALQKLIDDGVTGITRTADKSGEFVLEGDTATSFDLSSVNFENANFVSSSMTAGEKAFQTSSKSDLIIKNNLDDSGLLFENAAVKSSSNLATLKDLGTGGLTQSVAADFQTVVDDAITQLNGYRGEIGSTQNQVESAVRNLATQQTNIKAAESVIRDVDYAQESANFNKQNIISQAGSYAMSQANAVQQNVLRLLQ